MPPFRALVLDYPDDPHTYAIDDQFILGDRLLAAPVVAGETHRSIYLPKGDWMDFWSGTAYTGGQTYDLEVPLEIIPLFVKAGALLPLAHPSAHTADPASFTIDVRVFGDGSLPFTLYEDDGLTLAYENGDYNQVTLTWDPNVHTGRLLRSGGYSGPQYTITAWEPAR
jgi:alpha-D-xyloside xylohydrolase